MAMGSRRVLRPPERCGPEVWMVLSWCAQVVCARRGGDEPHPALLMLCLVSPGLPPALLAGQAWLWSLLLPTERCYGHARPRSCMCRSVPAPRELPQSCSALQEANPAPCRASS